MRSDELGALLSLRPQKAEPLKIGRLTRETVQRMRPRFKGAEVAIIVHPGYALFFDSAVASGCRVSVCSLLRAQLESEAKFIAQSAEKGRAVILVLPADPIVEGGFPHLYSAYLNRLVSGSDSVTVLFSKTSSSGSLRIDDMLSLYDFLAGAGVRKVIVGGGYIGRCQREFHSQLITYFDSSRTFISPEISVISTADISDKEAARIAKEIRYRRYDAVKSFMMRKMEEPLNIISDRSWRE